ncbi:MAG: hypothetical protein QM644_06990 [Mobilitalea sp.]
MNNKTTLYLGLLFLGICCVITSFFFNGEEVKAIGGVLIGTGSGFIGLSLSFIIGKYIQRKNPELEKQARIENNDERNILIRYRAKAKAGDITQWFIMGICYITILISAPVWVSLSVVGVFLIYNILGMYLMIKYQKEM